jgi:mono/diheme cytochrome c family protein
MVEQESPIPILVRVAIAISAALLITVCRFTLLARTHTASPQATFKAKCAMCHGDEGRGKQSTKTRDLRSAEVQTQSDDELAAIITRGKAPNMPAYKSMPPDEVKEIIKYIRSLKK